jgi:hypothetical protein
MTCPHRLPMPPLTCIIFLALAGLLALPLLLGRVIWGEAIFA